MNYMKIPVGIESFEELRQSGGYYVDKTKIISELTCERLDKVLLFTRPRRFGKTLMMQMLYSFFDIRKDSRTLFEGLAVMQQTDICKNWMNQYPVLFFSLKDVMHLTFEKACARLQSVIADVCKNFAFLENSEKTNDADKKIFHNLMYEQGSESNIESWLKVLTRMLFMHYEKPVILFIDEYDVPVSNAQEHGFYTDMISVIRNMLSIALKTNEFLKFAVITGCLRIAKESIFTGVNHFVSYSVLDEPFSDSFGFTENEVKQLLAAAGLKEKLPEIKTWYDGYRFGSSELYCPWDVVNYVKDLLYDQNQLPKNYWVHTSHNDMLKNFIDHNEWNLHDKFETLLNGGCLQQTITDEVTYDQLHVSEDYLWSILFMTGYLTKANNDHAEQTLIKIPNKEISQIFEQAVVRSFQDTLDQSAQKKLMNAVWTGNAELFAEILSDFLFSAISYHDYHEDFYHAFLTGIFQGIGCAVDSNREYGLGRTDLVIKDRKNRRAVLIEAKKAVSESAMASACEKGADQIQRMKYKEGIQAGYQQVHCYSIAFYKKQCMVKKIL